MPAALLGNSRDINVKEGKAPKPPPLREAALSSVNDDEIGKLLPFVSMGIAASYGLAKDRQSSPDATLRI